MAGGIREGGKKGGGERKEGGLDPIRGRSLLGGKVWSFSRKVEEVNEGWAGNFRKVWSFVREELKVRGEGG